MLFRKKECENCKDQRNQADSLRKQLEEAHARIDTLNAQLKKAHHSQSPLKLSDEYSGNFDPRPSEPHNEEAKQIVKLSDKDRFILNEKRAALKANASTTREDTPKPKVKMSDEDRQKLSEKRAALKAKLGPNSSEAREDRLRRKREEQFTLLKEACAQHFPALRKNLRRSQIVDDYGALIEDKRAKACAEFLNSLGFNESYVSKAEAVELIMDTMERLQKQKELNGFSSTGFPDDGLDFEHWVSDSFQKFGWDARATQGSADQGIDVIAKKDGCTLGVQCKRYTGSVGNKAVQEAFSGAKYLGLDRAAVLTNAEFTKSAKELAASTGVLLLSPDDIPTLSDRLKPQ